MTSQENKITLYRYVIRQFADLSGMGGFLFANRWNHKGSYLIYFSFTKEGALTEVMSRYTFEELIVLDYALMTIEINANDILDIQALNPALTFPIEEELSRTLGSEWAQSLTSLALKVPSIRGDFENVLINAQHPACAALKFELHPIS